MDAYKADPSVWGVVHFSHFLESGKAAPMAICFPSPTMAPFVCNDTICVADTELIVPFDMPMQNNYKWT